MLCEAQNLQADNPDLTPERMARVDAVIDRYKDTPGCLIPVLEECQEEVGYLPLELQDYISFRLNIPGSTVFGVVTFYSLFSMVPRGRHTIKVCMGTACYVRGIGEILQRIRSKYKLEVGGTSEDRRFSLLSVRCLGACGLAPVVVVDEDTHGGVTPEGITDILSRYE
ncbi:MAG: NAD(P)H-dependent oxidoreductase subunit E [Deltaproteobacteria bacterium]|nr:NAD(P)H-dependent oxidoreductase subunit E [Deltaproteobacteria bacterium]